MKAHVLFIYALAALALPCTAQTRFAFDQATVMHHNGNAVPEATTLVDQRVSGRHGVFFFGRGERSHGRNMGEAIGGWSLRAVRGVHVGLGTGFDQSVRSRIGMIMSVERWRIRAFGAYESGSGYPWHVVNVNSPSWHHVSAKLLSEAHLGTGPGINITLGHVMLWSALPYDRHTGGTNIVVGIAFEHELRVGREGDH